MTFKQNYRLDRVTFMDLLSKITPDLAPQPNQVCDDANVDPVIQLAITLRMLAGGSYLDIAFGYDVGLSSVYAIFKKVLVAIDNNVDNIQFPVDCEQALRDLEQTFIKFPKVFSEEL